MVIASKTFIHLSAAWCGGAQSCLGQCLSVRPSFYQAVTPGQGWALQGAGMWCFVLLQLCRSCVQGPGSPGASATVAA